MPGWTLTAPSPTWVDAFAGSPGITLPGSSGGRGFGSGAFKVDGAIFAMLVRGALVVKLPAPRVAALIEQGVGDTFDAGRGTPMREWMTVVGVDAARWQALAHESVEFHRSARGQSRKTSG